MPTRKAARAKRKSNGRSIAIQPRVRNWLAEADKLATKLPQAKHRADYRYFFLVRHPNLFPSPSSEGGTDIQLKNFRRELARYMRLLKKRTPQVIDGLDKSQSRQLAALVADSIMDLDDYFSKKELKNLAKSRSQSSGFVQIRKLNRLAKKAVKAVEELHTAASNADYRIGEHTKRMAEQCSPFLHEIKIPGNDDVVFAMKNFGSQQLANPLVPNMVRLYSFLRHGCGIRADEAQVRVGLIRNAFWTDYGWPVPVVEVIPKKKSLTKQKSCPAVAQAVRDYSRLQVPTAKKRR